MAGAYLSRRDASLGVLALLVPFTPGCETAQARRHGEDLAALEHASGGRLGVCVLDTASGKRLGHRAGDRFAMCSTFKLLLAAAVLREIDQGLLADDEAISFTQADMVPYAPVTERFLARGSMTVAALTEAAQVTSDNVAANLLLRRLGGPSGFTAKLRALGDATTRLDRIEPALNVVPPGELRDTSTPAAMAHTVAQIFSGDVLVRASRERLADWAVATRTGAKRLRAGLPAGWRAGDKTGTASVAGMTNKINDVAIVWPPGRAPVVIAAYFEAADFSESIRDEDQAVLAGVGRIASAWIEAER